MVRVTPDSEKHDHFLTDKWRQIVAWVITKFYFDFKNKGHRQKCPVRWDLVEIYLNEQASTEPKKK